VADLARLLIVFGLVLAAVGILLLVGARIPFLGRLPGDILVRRDGVTIYVPIVTSILLSILLTVLLNFFP
jgi:hypothetical protein